MNLSYEREQLVVKSNELIQRACYSLSVQQQRVILYLIAHIKPTDTELHAEVYDLRELCDVCGISYNPNNLQYFKNCIAEIDKDTWYVKVPGNPKQNKRLRWLHDNLILDTGNSTITIGLNPTLRDYLIELRNNFTAYELDNILAMKSKYSIRLYELLKSYAYLKTIQVDLSDLKELLLLRYTDSKGNVKESQYDRWQNFKDRVLEPALREISEYTDLTITYTTTRRGRKIHALEFTIKVKTSAQQLKTKLRREAALEREPSR